MKTIRSTITPPISPYAFPQKREEIAFFDIETTGLSARASSLYLIGAMYYDGTAGQWQLIQWFADDYHSEKGILQAFLDFLEKFQYLYHFNGKTFDIPYVMQKCQRHAISPSPHNTMILEDTGDCRSIDLLKHIRCLRKTLQLEKCSQTALEQWLGCQREDCFTGGDLIPVYSEYMQQRILAPEKAAALEKVLLLHNHDDVKMMLAVSSILSYGDYLIHPETSLFLQEECLNQRESSTQEESSGQKPPRTEISCPEDSCTQKVINGKISDTGDSLAITLETTISVPKKIALSVEYPETSASSEEWPENLLPLPRASLTLDGSECSLTIPRYQGTLKYYYANVKDYYYLPKEDMAVHKSIAEFVEKEYRQKATAATCYTKAEGIFLPCLAPQSRKKKSGEAPEELPHFFLSHKDKLSFRQLPEDYLQNSHFWQIYLREELHRFLL